MLTDLVQRSDASVPNIDNKLVKDCESDVVQRSLGEGSDPHLQKNCDFSVH